MVEVKENLLKDQDTLIEQSGILIHYGRPIILNIKCDCKASD